MLLRDGFLPGVCSFLAPPLAGIDEKFAKGACNYARAGPCGASSPARQVVNAHFPVGVASMFQLVK